ncbi:hypothetical protein TWF718_000305 [Orbilia javanica]|uniref:Uncharacterized protein n=1 Tax=Orbilia javanica TaxID=47235 RepID=A0AAN8MTQ2_9PEZI
MVRIFSRLPFWAQIVVSGVIIPSGVVIDEYNMWVASRENCKCLFCTQFTKEHKIHLQEEIKAGRDAKMPPGHYRIECIALTQSMKAEDLKVEFESAFRGLNMLGRGGKPRWIRNRERTCERPKVANRPSRQEDVFRLTFKI